MKTMKIIRLCTTWMLVISAHCALAGVVRPRQDPNSAGTDVQTDSPSSTSPGTSMPPDPSSTSVPGSTSLPDISTGSNSTATNSTSPNDTPSGNSTSSTNAPTNTTGSAVDPAASGINSTLPSNSSEPLASNITDSGSSSNTSSPMNGTSSSINSTLSSQYNMTTDPDNQFGFERPVYLTFLYFLNGRYVDNVTGKDVLPTKVILTFAGDDQHPATRFMLDQCDGSPCVRVERIRGDVGWARDTYAKADTFEIVLPSRAEIRNGSSTEPKSLGGADNAGIALDEMKSIARLPPMNYNNMTTNSNDSASVTLNNTYHSSANFGLAITSLGLILKAFEPQVESNAKVLTDPVFTNRMLETVQPGLISPERIQRQREMERRKKLQEVVERYKDMTAEEALKYTPKAFFRSDTDYESAQSAKDATLRADPTVQTDNPYLQLDPHVQPPPPSPKSGSSSTSSGDTASEAGSSSGSDSGSTGSGDAVSGGDTASEGGTAVEKRVRFSEEVLVSNGVSGDPNGIHVTTMNRLATDRLRLEYESWKAARRNAKAQAEAIRQIEESPSYVAGDDWIIENPFATALDETPNVSTEEENLTAEQVKAAAKEPISSFPEGSETSSSSTVGLARMTSGAFGDSSVSNFGGDVSGPAEDTGSASSSSSSTNAETPRGSSDLVVAANAESSVARARSAGIIRTATLVAKSAINAINVAGIVAGAAFIVVDFVNGNLVGGGLALAGLVTGVGIGLTFQLATTELGPVGWFIGGIVSLLFAIIPGLAGPAVDMPSPLDIQGILQWSFFRNTTHTGNEKCRTDSPGVKANPNCTAVFGPGLIARALNISPYNASILLIHYNGGYAMSIDDLATKFQYINPRHRDHTANEIALIDCIGNTRGPSGNEENPTGPGDTCEHPSYIINWNLITLPVINQTAKQVFSRVAPAPNADCRIVTYPEGQFFPDYNFTAHGLPTAISCGIQPGLNVSGTLVNATTQAPIVNGSITSSASNSTDHVSGTYIAPPPKTSFAPFTNTACLSDINNKTVCLPPGSFPPPNVLSTNIGKLHQLTLSPGAKINVNYPCAWITVNANYTTNITIADPVFHPQQINKDIGFLELNKVSNPHPITVFPDPSQPSPHGFCIFGGKNYTGDFACFGPGGDDLPSQWQNKAKSLQVIQGTRVEIFGTSYGDVSGTPLEQNEPDLSDLYIGNSNFAQKFVAAWAQ